MKFPLNFSSKYIELIIYSFLALFFGFAKWFIIIQTKLQTTISNENKTLNNININIKQNKKWEMKKLWIFLF